MKWHDITESKPPSGEEVLVWIDGHRSAAWRNNYALVAYYENGDFWEERHHSQYPLVGVMKWAKIPTPKA